MTLVERRRSLTSCQGEKVYFDMNKCYAKTGWTVENGVAYTNYCYHCDDFGKYGSLSFVLDAGTYNLSFLIMLVGSQGLQYRVHVHNDTTNSSTFVRAPLTLGSKNQYYYNAYTFTITKESSCRLAIISEPANVTYLKNIRIEKVG